MDGSSFDLFLIPAMGVLALLAWLAVVFLADPQWRARRTAAAAAIARLAQLEIARLAQLDTARLAQLEISRLELGRLAQLEVAAQRVAVSPPAAA